MREWIIAILLGYIIQVMILLGYIIFVIGWDIALCMTFEQTIIMSIPILPVMIIASLTVISWVGIK